MNVRFARRGNVGRLVLLALLGVLWAAGAEGRGARGNQWRPADEVPAEQAFGGHAAGVRAVAFTPDDRLIVSASADRTIKVWDVAAGRLLRTIEGHQQTVNALDVSPDGTKVASGSDDGTARVWDLKTGEIDAILEGHTGSVRSVFFAPGGRLISGATGDGIRIWDLKTEKTVFRSQGAEGGGVGRMSATPDRSRVAILNMDDGGPVVWDVKAGKVVRRFPAVGAVYQCVLISPDGAEVWGPARSDQGGVRVRRWDVASGRVLDEVSAFGPSCPAAFSPDGRYIAAEAGLHPALFDARTLKPLVVLEMVMSQSERAVTISPDGRWLGAGIGGDDRTPRRPTVGENAVMAHPIPVPGAGPTVPAAPPVGKVSWEFIPAVAKMLDGRTVSDLYDLPWQDRPRHWSPAARPLGARTDALWCGHHLFVYEAANRGVLREVLGDADGGIADVVWDGRNAWVATNTRGVVVLDPSGRTVATIGTREGLPPAAKFAVLYPLAPGRVLIAGSGGAGERETEGTGFCAVMEWSAGTGAGAAGDATPKVRVLVREADLPAEWCADRKLMRKQTVFAPLWAFETPAGAPAAFPAWATTPAEADPRPAANPARRTVWIGCQTIQGQDRPMLRIDPETMAVAPYNLQPASLKDRRHEPFAFYHEAAPIALGPAAVLNYHSSDIRICPLDEGRTDISRGRSVLSPLPHPRQPLVGVRFIESGGHLYLPGANWYRIDRDTLDVELLGPGLRGADGQLIQWDVSYFGSAVLGLGAFAPADGGFYRVSVDPAHPAPVRGTADPLIGRPIPPEGAIRAEGGMTAFYCGAAALRFFDGKLQVLDTKVGPRYRDSLAAARLEEAVLQNAANQAQQRGQRERLGMTDEQFAGLQATRALPVVRGTDGARWADGRGKQPPGPDAACAEALFAKFEKAADGPERDAAIKALMAEAKAFGEAEAARLAKSIADRKAPFTPAQLRKALYMPDAEGK